MTRKAYPAFFSGVFVATVIVAGCRSQSNREQSTVPVVTGVTVEAARLRDTYAEYTAPGTMRSATTSVLGAQISGTVREVHVKPGDRVKREEVLAVIDDRS